MSSTAPRPRTLLICHHDAPLDFEGLARWLGSFSQLVGIVRITEPKEMLRRRAKREMSRIGPIRFVDMLAFRVHYRLTAAAADASWETAELAGLCARYPALADVPVHETQTPNSPETEAFIAAASPDLMIARCKFLLKKSVFTIPTRGTLVMHPGVCPEYRNAHGCFWALANDDLDKVGVTLLKVDAGVDTGPVYGYFSYPFDERAESHVRIQARCVTENLDALAAAMLRIHDGTAQPIDTVGRPSAVWGQPWLSKYLGWKARAKRRAG